MNDQRREIEILESGLQATVQDYPGRTGMLRQGFFPAGAMDFFSLRAANLLVGNPQNAAGIEVTLGGFAMRLHAEAAVAVCGAQAEVTLDGEELSRWESRVGRHGSELRIAISPGPGFRLYVGIAGGIDVPELFGSRATYTMGGLGGFEGRFSRPAIGCLWEPRLRTGMPVALTKARVRCTGVSGRSRRCVVPRRRPTT
jgi:allophanate hydrolase subunit 2